MFCSSAIFQEDCKIVSGSSSPPQIVIKLRFPSLIDVCLHSSLPAWCVLFIIEMRLIHRVPCDSTRPYSKDMGYEDTDISAMLIVR